MKPTLIYLAGVLTPVAVLAALGAWLRFQDWRDDRRYRKAWDKFGAEFGELTPGQLEFWQAKWAKDGNRYVRYADDQSRYFAMRWNNGATDEI